MAAGPAPGSCSFHWWLCCPLGLEASIGPAGSQLDVGWEEMEGPEAKRLSGGCTKGQPGLSSKQEEPLCLTHL